MDELMVKIIRQSSILILESIILMIYITTTNGLGLEIAIMLLFLLIFSLIIYFFVSIIKANESNYMFYIKDINLFGLMIHAMFIVITLGVFILTYTEAT